MLVVAVPQAAGPSWIYDRDSSEHQGAGSIQPTGRRAVLPDITHLLAD
jgi:hypothetical protein